MSTTESQVYKSGRLTREEGASLESLMLCEVLTAFFRRGLVEPSEGALQNQVHETVGEELAKMDLEIDEKDRDVLEKRVCEEAVAGLPLSPLMADPSITDILVNAPDQVYIERNGQLEKTNVRFHNKEQILKFIRGIAMQVGRKIDAGSPMVDARLADGSRVNATVPPVSVDGPTLSIRRFGLTRLRSHDLLAKKMFSSQMEWFLHQVVRGRKSILISGGTGSGKSTLLGALAEAIPDSERIVTIEDTIELMLDQQHVVRMESQPEDLFGHRAITMRDLVRNALRMRPDRIIVGEVRGAEAFDMLQAMNTGHEGSLTTLHANSPRDAIARLESMVLMAGMDLPARAILEQIVSAIRVVVHVRRYEDGVRRIERISELTGMEEGTPTFHDIFVFERRQSGGRVVVGEFVPTGLIPRVVRELNEQSVSIPYKLFQQTPEEFEQEWSADRLRPLSR